MSETCPLAHFLVDSCSNQVPTDLNERNCMWGMASLHNLNRSAKYEAFGRPLKEIISDFWKQGELVGPVEIPEDLRTEQFYLGDFALAKKLADSMAQPGYPPSLFCSPERLHGKDSGFACDMWSYMVIFGVLYLGCAPFTPIFRGGIISGITLSLGPLPEQWKGLYVWSGSHDSWYDQHKTPHPKWNLESRIAYLRPDADPVEQQLVHSIMSKVFVYNPEERITASQLLRDPSFRALMDRYGC